MMKNICSGKSLPEMGHVRGSHPTFIAVCLVLILTASPQVGAQTSGSTSAVRLTAGVEAFMMHSQAEGDSWYSYQFGPVLGVIVPIHSREKELFSVEGRIGGLCHLHTGLALSRHLTRNVYVSLGADWYVYRSKSFLYGMGHGYCDLPSRCGTLSDFLIDAGLGADIGPLRVEGRAGHSLSDVDIEYFDKTANHNRTVKSGLWSFSISLMYSFEW